MQFNSEGYVFIFRKIRNDWKGKKLEYAWTWVDMILSANWKDDYPVPGLKRGELRIKRIMELGSIIKWKNKMQPSRFLELCQKAKDVTISLRSRYDGVTITICDYDKYQPTCDDTVTNSLRSCYAPENNGSVLRREKGRSKKKNKSTSLRSSSAPKDLETINQRLSEIDLASYRNQYEKQGVNVCEVWEEFQDKCINGTGQVDEPNPYNYKNFKNGFHTFCRNRLRDVKAGKSPFYNKPDERLPWDG